MDDIKQLLDSFFGLSVAPREISVAQMTARALLVFASALVMLRVAHKRFFAQRNALDVLLTLVIASTLARAINGSAAFFPTLVVGFVLVLVHRALGWASVRSPWLGIIVKGTSTVLVQDGQVRHPELRRHDLSIDDLNEDLRINGVDTPQAVRRATLERNGEVSVIAAKSS